jgi:hypothetical protein
METVEAMETNRPSRIYKCYICVIHDQAAIESGMLRIKDIKNAKQTESYYAKSDGGYYLSKDELRCEWGGSGAEFLGLSGPPDFEQFKRLIHGLDPHTGEQLTAKLIEDRIPGWDINVSCPKGVTTTLERGDTALPLGSR